MAGNNRRRWAGLLMALVVGVAATLLTPLAAQAKDLGDVFTNWSNRHGGAPAITITTTAHGDIPPEDQVYLWDNVKVQANWDTSGLAPRAGDTFALDLPQQFTIPPNGFALTAPDDTEIGTCSVTGKSGDTPGRVTCTLTGDYWATHTGVSGSLGFTMQAIDRSGETPVQFGVGNAVVFVPLPGDGTIGPPYPWPIPGDIEKVGWFDNEGDYLTWRIYIPGDKINENPLTVVDNLSAGQTFDSVTFDAIPNTQEGWTDFLNNGPQDNVPYDQRALTVEGQTISVSIPQPDVTKLYVVNIRTKIDNPGAVVPGTEFDNTAVVQGQNYSTTAVRLADAGGQGQGYVNGFSLVKQLDGDAAAAAANADFTVRYSYAPEGGDPVSETLTFKAGATVGHAPIPAGTVVTLTEIDLPAIDGVTWGVPTFSGEGVTDLGNGTATFTVIRNQTIQITLTNLAQPSTPESTPPASTPESTPPASTPEESTPEDTAPEQKWPDDEDDYTPRGLPETGSGGSSGGTAVVVLLALAAAAVAGARRS